MTISAERVKSLIADHDSRYLMSESTTEGRFHADTAAALRIALAVIEPSEETVERAARAMCGASYIDPDAYENNVADATFLQNWTIYTSPARAALSALRSETETGKEKK